MDLIRKKYIKVLLFFCFVFYSAQIFAVTVNDAVNALEELDNVEAVKIWKQLASKGNSIAQYNLARHYITGKGVKKNKQAANLWLKKSSRSGFVQAYLNLNKKAIAPANGISLIFNTGPMYWLNKQDSKKYTIQIASSRKVKTIKKYYRENNMKDNGGYYHYYTSDGRERYALVFGTYRTVAAAKQAIEKLPQKFRDKTPWVRNIKALQEISIQ